MPFNTSNPIMTHSRQLAPLLGEAKDEHPGRDGAHPARETVKDKTQGLPPNTTVAKMAGGLKDHSFFFHGSSILTWAHGCPE